MPDGLLHFRATTSPTSPVRHAHELTSPVVLQVTHGGDKHLHVGRISIPTSNHATPPLPVQPVRVVFIITELDQGGAEGALTRLVGSLDRSEWSPHVICLGPPGHYVGVLTDSGIDVTCLNATGWTSLPRVLWQLTRCLRRLRPQIVQTFLFHANVLGRVAARIAGVRCVVSGLRVADRRSNWYGRIDRWTNFLVTSNVCVSQGVADDALRAGIPASKIVVIPNSVDIDRFINRTPADLAEFGIPAGSRVFITIGRLDRQKGIDLLLEALAFCPRLDSDIHLLIVGDGPESDALCTQASSNPWKDRIHFAGRRQNVPELLAAAWALVLPSRWEGMPNVVLEAMAAGRPVIATHVEGVAELVQDQLSGLVVPRGDSAALARALVWLTAHPAFRDEAGRKAQQFVAEKFTTPAVTASYVDLYRRLLSID